MAEQEPRFQIDGKEYPLPTSDDLTMDEAIVVFDYSGLSLDQIEGNGGNPKVIKALMHIAYQRGNPGVSEDEVRSLVGSAVLVGALRDLMAPEADAGPPAQETTQATESSETSSGSSNSGSGSDSTIASDAQEGEQTPTGIHRLPSSISDVKTSVA